MHLILNTGPLKKKRKTVFYKHELSSLLSLSESALKKTQQEQAIIQSYGQQQLKKNLI